MAGVGIFKHGDGSREEALGYKVDCCSPPHPPPRFFPRSPPPPFLSFPSHSAPEGRGIDFIGNNRRVGELRPAQTRSPVTGLCWLPV